MSGVIYHQNQGKRQISKEKIQRYYEQIDGKTAILKTWEETGRDTDEHEYIIELKKRIRVATVLLSHIRP